MIVKETRDVGEIRSILCDPAIYDTITADGDIEAGEFEPPLDGHRYLGGYIDGQIFGLMVYHKNEDINYCHVQVLKSHRADHAREFGYRVLAEREKGDLYAIIPECYENVLSFAESFGFEVIAAKQGSYQKGGQTFDDYVLRLREVTWDS